MFVPAPVTGFSMDFDCACVRARVMSVKGLFRHIQNTIRGSAPLQHTARPDNRIPQPRGFCIHQFTSGTQ